jgi:hypothetical protein
MLARTRHPHARPVIALPDLPRYRDLYRDTAPSLCRCGIDLWWVSQNGAVTPPPYQ